METVTHIIDALGGNRTFAELIGAPHQSTASEMKRRKSIPVRYWPVVLEAARTKGLTLSSDDLVRMHTREDAA